MCIYLDAGEKWLNGLHLANIGGPGQTLFSGIWSWSSLFTNYHFGGFKTKKGENYEGIWAATSENVLSTCVLSEDSNKPAHSHSLIRIYTGHILNSQGCKVSSCRQQRLIDCACTGCFESLLCVHVRRYVFSRRRPYVWRPFFCVFFFFFTSWQSPDIRYDQMRMSREGIRFTNYIVRMPGKYKVGWSCVLGMWQDKFCHSVRYIYRSVLISSRWTSNDVRDVVSGQISCGYCISWNIQQLIERGRYFRTQLFKTYKVVS